MAGESKEELKKGPGRPRRDPISDEQKVEVKRLRVEQIRSVMSRRWKSSG